MPASILNSTLLLAAASGLFGQVAAPESPSSLRIAAAEKRLQGDSKSAPLHIELAAALCRRARDTDDVRLYERAGAMLERALQLSRGNYEARKLQVTVLLGQHQFGKALEAAKELNRTTPDDLGVWALLVEANVALGDYTEAEKDAQWVLDLRPGNTLGFLKAAELREWFGDLEGASEFYREALRRVAMGDLDERAWLYTQNARVQLELGNLSNAAGSLDEAMKLDAHSLAAAALLARLREREGRYVDAASLLETRYRAVPSLANLHDYATGMELAGKSERAAALFQEFEGKAEAARSEPLNANRQLIFYYADRKHDPQKALAVARQEVAIRHDYPTLDAYAWALYGARQFPEAKTQVDRAMAVGVRDSAGFCHAARIAAAAGDDKGAHHWSALARESGPGACSAEAALPLAAKGDAR